MQQIPTKTRIRPARYSFWKYHPKNNVTPKENGHPQVAVLRMRI
jgi:hypothetical protein